jgi:hypothetical protein
MIQELLLQVAYYFVAMLFGLVLSGLLLRGYFGVLIRVRLSWGKLLVVKIRQVHRDYIKVGEVKDGFLVYGRKQTEKRIAIPSNEYFYRVGGLMWVDVDEELNALVKPDYSGVSGFDAVKYNNLYIRTLFKPSVADNQDKIIIIGLLLIVVLIVVVGFLVYKNGYSLNFLVEKAGATIEATKNVITNS